MAFLTQLQQRFSQIAWMSNYILQKLGMQLFSHILIPGIKFVKPSKRDLRKSRKLAIHYHDVITSAMASQITGVSIVCSTVCFRCRSKKTSKLCFTGHVDSLHKGPLAWKMFPFDDVFMEYGPMCHMNLLRTAQITEAIQHKTMPWMYFIFFVVHLKFKSRNIEWCFTYFPRIAIQYNIILQTKRKPQH